MYACDIEICNSHTIQGAKPHSKTHHTPLTHQQKKNNVDNKNLGRRFVVIAVWFNYIVLWT